ncbi:hypothetical protein P700755_004024 [Psychroflexus torquis ATCC 700755]|uniref:Uncharacterized protein n=1 Tax=Psychroflexus torquis (strain ATCC 700755 / CIP 106069 / ACAM 623) TaxID=313595 RepID=K4IJR7_PSYTT|nr:hypothetical protein P700755_004024 [Psychroflexus torquis ATCC 700755]
MQRNSRVIGLSLTSDFQFIFIKRVFFASLNFKKNNEKRTRLFFSTVIYRLRIEIRKLLNIR